MKLKNAINKLLKAGWVEMNSPEKTSSPFWLYAKQNYEIVLYCNPPENDGSRNVVVIDFRRKGMEDDIQTDYHAGTFCDSIAQALRFAESSEKHIKEAQECELSELEKDTTVKLALGRILRMGSRPTQPGDVQEYERCKGIIIDILNPNCKTI